MIRNENFNFTIVQKQSKFKVIYVGFFNLKNRSIRICHINSKLYIYSDLKYCRYDCRYVKFVLIFIEGEILVICILFSGFSY